MVETGGGIGTTVRLLHTHVTHISRISIHKGRETEREREKKLFKKR